MSFETLVILVVVTFHACFIHLNIRDAEKNIINKLIDPIFSKNVYIANFLLTFLIVVAMYLLRFLYNMIF